MLRERKSYRDIIADPEAGVRSYKTIRMVKEWIESGRISFDERGEPVIDDALLRSLDGRERSRSPEQAALGAATKRAVEKSASFSLERLDGVLDVGTYCLETFGNIAALEGEGLKEFLRDAVSFYQVWRNYIESLQGERDALEWGLDQTLQRMKQLEREIELHKFVEDNLIEKVRVS